MTEPNHCQMGDQRVTFAFFCAFADELVHFRRLCPAYPYDRVSYFDFRATFMGGREL